MVLKRTAFRRPIHEKICKQIMATDFNQKVFSEVHSWMDGLGGGDHRFKHGHNKEAEAEIREKWGEIGVEMFRIHILSDRVQERLPEIVAQDLKKLKASGTAFPYFQVESIPPECEYLPTLLVNSEEFFPESKNSVNGCRNCHGNEELVFSARSAPICKKCLFERSVISCGNCDSLFSSGLKIESMDDPTVFLCPICNKAPA